jgi:hypothetical protein
MLLIAVDRLGFGVILWDLLELLAHLPRLLKRGGVRISGVAIENAISLLA